MSLNLNDCSVAKITLRSSHQGKQFYTMPYICLLSPSFKHTGFGKLTHTHTPTHPCMHTHTCTPTHTPTDKQPRTLLHPHTDKHIFTNNKHLTELSNFQVSCGALKNKFLFSLNTPCQVLTQQEQARDNCGLTSYLFRVNQKYLQMTAKKTFIALGSFTYYLNYSFSLHTLSLFLQFNCNILPTFSPSFFFVPPFLFPSLSLFSSLLFPPFKLTNL